MQAINEKLFSIDKVLKKSVFLFYLSILISLIALLISFGYVFYIQKDAMNNIYVLDNEGDINPAYKSNIKDDFKAEADNHIKMFYHTFFTYDPQNVEMNLAKGLELGGKSVKDLYKLYKQKNFYNQIKQKNIIIKSQVDSIKFDLSKKPFFARVYGKQKIISGSHEQERFLNMDCNLYRVSRVRGKNPHGILIDNVIITNNKLIPNEKEN